jgi:hypothetical protein
MVAVRRIDGFHRLVGDGHLVEFSNRWIDHLEAQQFSSGTVRGYVCDLLCLARLFDKAEIDWQKVMLTDFFDQFAGPSSRNSRQHPTGTPACSAQPRSASAASGSPCRDEPRPP